MFTIALNGYDAAYRSCIRSQATYCRKNGFSHVVVCRPLRINEVALSAWLKISLMEKALSSGDSWIAFIDADARVKPGAPDFRTVDDGEHSVYAAKGRSGRWNSGVIFAKPHAGSRSFFSSVLRSAELPCPTKTGTTCASRTATSSPSLVRPAPSPRSRWRGTNTYETDLDDHVRHFTGR